KQAAETANQAKTLYIANLAHEIKTPLGVILGFTELLRKRLAGQKDEKIGQWLRTVERNGKMLKTLTEDTLDLARIEAGRLEIHPKEVALGELLRETFFVLDEAAHEKGLSLALTIPETLPARVLFDPTRFRQILFN